MESINKLKLNTVASLITRFAILVSGFVLPRLILTYYGSETNGIISSINQFLNVIVFLDLGVGAVVQSSLYQPLAKNDNLQLNLVIASARKYFKKIAYILIIYVILLIIFYPMLVFENINYFSTVFLIFGMSINFFAQYYFGIVNELLLNADQKSYIQFGAETIVVVLNLLASVYLITSGASIQVVKISTGFIYLLRAVYLNYYVNKHYIIDTEIEVTKEPLTNKWNGMAQHVAWAIQNSTDIVILTLFSTLENVSIYAVYSMVVNGVKLLISSLTNSLNSFFGNLIAKNEFGALNSYFTKLEWFIHTGVIYLFGMTATLITPFVKIYTSGVTDVNYHAPMFSLMLIIAHAIYCLRIPYQAVILAAGHYKQTQTSSILEALINIIVSLSMVYKFGLIGVTLGTLSAMIYRLIYLVWYVSLNIIKRPITLFVKQIIVDIVSFGIILFIGLMLSNIEPINTINDWLIMAIIFAILFLVLVLIINVFFYKKIMISVIKYFFR